jgi:SPP1 gp7 family putative phage head morphogenesis protein
MHIARRRAAIEKTINDHIVWPMVVSNFGFIEEYPKFRFKPLDDMKAIELAKVWLDAVKSNVFPANDEEINYFRSLCKFPEGEVQPKSHQLFPGSNLVQRPQDPNILNDEGEAEDEETSIEERIPTEREAKGPYVEKADEEKRKVNKRQFGKIFNLPSGDYHKKVDFKKIEAKLDDYDNSVLVEAMPIIKKQFKDLADQIQKKGILKNQDVSKIDKLQIKYLKELKQVLKTSFAGIYKDGQNLAQAELMKSNFATPVASDAFLAMLEEETFQYIGDYQYTILKKTRLELIAAIKDGAPLSSVLDILDSEGQQLAEVSLERYARTKHTEVLNKGRIEFFESSGVVAGYQYSAILDDVTSEICRGLDGKYFEAGSQPIPPMHFNALRQDSLIETTEGKKLISEIKIGDKVLTHKNSYCEVYDVMSKFEDKEYYEINLDNGKQINITAEHPVLVIRDSKLGWSRVDELTMADRLLCVEDFNEI